MKTKNIFEAAVEDYHEFQTIKRHLKLAGLIYKFEELGFYKGSYHAVFWLKSEDRPAEFIKDCLAKFD